MQCSEPYNIAVCLVSAGGAQDLSLSGWLATVTVAHWSRPSTSRDARHVRNGEDASP